MLTLLDVRFKTLNSIEIGQGESESSKKDEFSTDFFIVKQN